MRFIQWMCILHLIKRAAGMVRDQDALRVLDRSTALLRKNVRVTGTLVHALRKFGEYRPMKQMILITLAYTMDKTRGERDKIRVVPRLRGGSFRVLGGIPPFPPPIPKSSDP